jgi:hypothetical protein
MQRWRLCLRVSHAALQCVPEVVDIDGDGVVHVEIRAGGEEVHVEVTLDEVRGEG